jgi:multidrug efflux system membrane fusion protein
VAEARTMPIELRAVGRIVANRSVAIRAQVAGPIVKVHFREGATVREGDLLLEIDPRPHRAALAEAEARLAQDRARAENARADATRYADLVEKEFVTRQQHDAARAAALAAEAQVLADEAAVQRARLNLSHATVRAPLSGRTGRLLVQEGNLVAAGAGEPLLTIEQVKPAFAAFSLPERHLPALRDWRSRRIVARVHAGGATAGEGPLEFVDNAVDPQTGTVLLKARLDNADEALWPGQIIDVSLHVGDRPGAIVVPAAAVAQGQQGDYAYVVGPEKKAELRLLKAEPAGDREVVILSGLSAGERVVTEGQVKLSPGALVEPLGEARKAPGT